MKFLQFTPLMLIALIVNAAQPKMREKAPDFSLSSTDGATVRLSDRIKDGPLVLIALRGFPGYQCPVCNRQVQDFLKSAPAFAELNARVLMVYPGPAADLEKRAKDFMADKKFPPNFELVLDPNYEFTNLYGLRWDAPNETAYPSTFLFDKDGKIVFAKISDSHGGRTSAAEVVELVKKAQRR